MSQQILQRIEEFAKPFCERDQEDTKLWENHVRLVRKYACELAEIEGVDSEVVEIAAILHDIGKCEGREGHAVRSYDLAKDFVNSLGLPQDKVGLILKCILKHGNKNADEENEIEVEVVQSADALGTLFDEEWQDYSRKTIPTDVLLGLFAKTYGKINLESARRIAEPQVEKLKKLAITQITG